MYKEKSMGGYCSPALAHRASCHCHCHSTHQLQRNVYGATAGCSNKTDPFTTAKARMDNRAVIGVALRYEGNPLVSLHECPQVEGRTWTTTKANIGFSSSSSAAWNDQPMDASGNHCAISSSYHLSFSFWELRFWKWGLSGHGFLNSSSRLWYWLNGSILNMYRLKMSISPMYNSL